jgi:esterase/lipase superfamily enzyme
MSNLIAPSYYLSSKKPNCYAIQNNNSEFRNWNHFSEKSVVKFDWSKFGVVDYAKKEDIIVSVAHALPNSSKQEIQGISEGIFLTSKIKKGDIILQVAGGRNILKLGFVSTPDIHPYFTQEEIHIEWKQQFHGISSSQSIFKYENEIQKLSQSTINRLPAPVKELFPYLTDEYFYSKEYGDPFEHFEEYKISPDPKEDGGGSIKLFFGTNRFISPHKPHAQSFEDEIDQLKFGFCNVSIPRGHKLGEIERPKKYWILHFPEKESEHIIVKDVEIQEEESFFLNLTNHFNEIPEKTGLIFIHGYNTSFNDAAKRTAQIAWDVPFNGLAGFFSWPSSAKIPNYFRDGELADASVKYLEEFIEKLVHKTGIEKLHLIGHSMGNKLFTVSLNNLSQKESFKSKLKVIHEIVLAAPDIDQDVFKHNILPHLKGIGKRRTLYSSDHDTAIKLSETFRRGIPRLGSAGGSLFVADGLDTIDASNIKSRGLHHSYVFDTKELLSDLYYLIDKGLDPLNRRLHAKKFDALTYWLFPK